MINKISPTLHKFILGLLFAVIPMLAMSQTALKGPRWYDEGKLARRINISNLTNNEEIPLFEQCLDGEYHVSLQLKFDIEARTALKDWEYGFDVELIKVSTSSSGVETRTSLLKKIDGTSGNGPVSLKVSNNEEQTFVSSTLYGDDNSYLKCNEVVNDAKISYFVKVTNYEAGDALTVPITDISLEFRLYEKPRYWIDYSANTESKQQYLKAKNTSSSVYEDIRFNAREVIDDERVLANWDYAEGAWGYELEWVFIGSYEEESTALGVDQPTSASAIFQANYKDPVRVETNLQHYEFATTYPEGKLYLRVRPVGRYSEEYPNQVTNGAWVYQEAPIETQGFTRKIDNEGIEEELDITWSAVTTFAEKGKSKKVVTFFDNSMRPRQVTTDLSTDKHTLVAETYYDHEGRGTISVLPVPDPKNTLEFRPIVNQFNLNGDYVGQDPKDFYDNLEAGAITLSDNYGAGKYYSPKNEVGGIHRDYIPDAEGYSYTQVIYENDGLGRIKAQSGVGKQFALKADGGNGALNQTITKYAYSTPEQEELIRIFGKIKVKDEDGNDIYISAAGDAAHFQKQLVTDPNGQTSVSYLDQNGQVRATALYGDSPSNLKALDTKERDLLGGSLTVDLTQKNVQDLMMNRVVKRINHIGAEQSYTFEYKFNGNANTEITTSELIAAVNPAYNGNEAVELSLLSEYRLEIEVFDPDGRQIELLDATAQPYLKEDGTNGVEVSLSGNTPQTFKINTTFNKEGDYLLVKKLILEDQSITDLIELIKGTNAFDDKADGDKTIGDLIDKLEDIDSDLDGLGVIQKLLEARFVELSGEDGSCMDDIEINDGVGGADEFNDTRGEVLAKEDAETACDEMLQRILSELAANPTKWLDANGTQQETEHPAYPFYVACLANSCSKVFESQLKNEYSTLEEANAAGIIASVQSLIDHDPYFTIQQGADACVDASGNSKSTQVHDALNLFTITHDNCTASDVSDDVSVTDNIFKIFSYENPLNEFVNPNTGYNILYAGLSELEAKRREWTFIVSMYLNEKKRAESQLMANHYYDAVAEGTNIIIQDPGDYVVDGATITLEDAHNDAVDLMNAIDVEVVTDAALSYYLEMLNSTCYDYIVDPANATEFTTLRNYLKSYFEAFPYKNTADEWQQNISGSILAEDVARANSAATLAVNDPALHLRDFTNYINNTLCTNNAVNHEAQAAFMLDRLINLHPISCRNDLWASEGEVGGLYENILGKLTAYFVSFGNENPMANILVEDADAVNNNETLSARAQHLQDIIDLLQGSTTCNYVDAEPIGDEWEFNWDMLVIHDPTECKDWGTRTVVTGVNKLPARKFAASASDYATAVKAKADDKVFEDNTYIEAVINPDLSEVIAGVFPIISNLDDPTSATTEQYEFGLRVNSTTSKELYFTYLPTGLPHPTQGRQPVTVSWDVSSYDLGSCDYTVALKYNQEINETTDPNCRPCSECDGLQDQEYADCIWGDDGSALDDCDETCPTTIDLTGSIKFYLMNMSGEVVAESPNTAAYSLDHWIFGSATTDSKVAIHKLNWNDGNPTLIGGYIQDVRLYQGLDNTPYGVDTYGSNNYPIIKHLSQVRRIANLVGQWKMIEEGQAGVVYELPDVVWDENESCLYGLVYGDEPVCIQTWGEYGGGAYNPTGYSFELTDMLIEELKQECLERTREALMVDIQEDADREALRLAKMVSMKHNSLSLRNVGEELNYTITPKDYHFTLYYYDQAGNLTQTVPPEGVNLLTNTEITTNTEIRPEHTMKTRYAYNTLGELVWQSTPDGGVSEFWYDELGRIRLSQNGKQKVKGKYTYTKYDELGRSVEVGQLERALDGQPLAIAKGAAVLNELDFPSMQTYVLDERTITHYDNLEKLPYLGGKELPEDEVFKAENLRGRVAWTEVQNSKYALRRDANDPNSPLVPNAYVYSYDIHGNVVQILQASLSNRITDYDFDLISGNVNHVDFHSEKDESRFIHRYAYDADNRLISVETSSDGYIWFEDAEYFYYAHGPLARVELGEYKVQGVDYYYNLQGWIKGVNASGKDETVDPGHDGDISNARHRFVSQDAFAYNLGYYDGDYKPIGGSSINPDATSNWQAFAKQDVDGNELSLLKHTGTHKYGLYNGNIALMATDLKYFGDDGIQMMAYEYDQLNRIRQAKSFKQSNGTWSDLSNNFTTRYDYDGNGNLMHLDRYNGTGTLMDQLSYHYQNRKVKDKNGVEVNERINRLNQVYDWGKDATSPDYDFTTRAYSAYTAPTVGSGNISEKDFISQGEGNYEYDEIGNLIKDRSEGVLEIEWTIQGKVKRVLKDDRSEVTYQYDATGNRLLKRVRKPDQQDALTFYFRDASGNVMETYKSHHNKKEGKDYLEQEYAIYGSGRIGMYRTKNVIGGEVLKGVTKGLLTLGSRSFELSNHLDNVLSVITDNKQMPLNVDGEILKGEDNRIAFFEVKIVTANDYYPFGLGMEERKFEDEEYRFGFQGQEIDKEVLKGDVPNFKYRMHNPAIGRFFAVDPLAPKYPHNSPYAFSENSVIAFIELEGLEKVYNTKGHLIATVGDNTDKYIMSQSNYCAAVLECQGNDVNLSSYIAQNATRAYSTEEEAAAAWAPLGYALTKGDQGDKFERATAIFHATDSEGGDLYVFGSTVIGEHSDHAQNGEQVNPFKSKAMIGNINLLDVTYRKMKKVESKKYKGSGWSLPLLVRLGIMENPTTVKWFAEEHSVWSITGLSHTHTPDEIVPMFSAAVSGDYERPVGGDVGVAADYNVYLVPTSTTRLTYMYLLKKHGKTYFGSHVNDAVDWGKKNKIRININPSE